MYLLLRTWLPFGAAVVVLACGVCTPVRAGFISMPAAEEGITKIDEASARVGDGWRNNVLSNPEITLPPVSTPDAEHTASDRLGSQSRRGKDIEDSSDPGQDSIILPDFFQSKLQTKSQTNNRSNGRPELPPFQQSAPPLPQGPNKQMPRDCPLPAPHTGGSGSSGTNNSYGFTGATAAPTALAEIHGGKIVVRLMHQIKSVHVEPSASRLFRPPR